MIANIIKIYFLSVYIIFDIVTYELIPNILYFIPNILYF